MKGLVSLRFAFSQCDCWEIKLLSVPRRANRRVNPRLETLGRNAAAVSHIHSNLWNGTWLAARALFDKFLFPSVQIVKKIIMAKHPSALLLVVQSTAAVKGQTCVFGVLDCAALLCPETSLYPALIVRWHFC